METVVAHDLSGREAYRLQYPVVSPAGQSREHLEPSGSYRQENKEQRGKVCAAGPDFELLPLGTDKIIMLRDQNAVLVSAWLIFAPSSRLIRSLSGFAPARPLNNLDLDDFIAKPFRRRELVGCVFELMQRDAVTGGAANTGIEYCRT